jgi:hypothetical protein
MTKSNLVSLKTQSEIERFHNLLRRCGNIYLSDIDRMDRAFNIVADNERMNKAFDSVVKNRCEEQTNYTGWCE